MDSDDVAAVVAEVTTLVNEHYVDPAAAVQITRALAASLAGGRYAADEQSLAAAVTADLQSVNGDKHLRLVYHAAPLPASEPGATTIRGMWPAPSARSPAATGKAAASRPISAPPPERRRTGPTSWRSTTSARRPGRQRKHASQPRHGPAPSLLSSRPVCRAG